MLKIIHSCSEIQIHELGNVVESIRVKISEGTNKSNTIVVSTIACSTKEKMGEKLPKTNFRSSKDA